MTMPNVRHAIFAAAGLIALSVAACGGTSTTSSGATTGAASEPSAASTTASASAGSAQPIDVCVTLTAPSAAQLSGQPITTATEMTEQAPPEYGCAYDSADDSVQVEVQVFKHDAASSYATFLAATSGASMVGGLGDKAFFDSGTMYVLAGSNLIQVNGLNTADECAALARPVLAAL